MGERPLGCHIVTEVDTVRCQCFRFDIAAPLGCIRQKSGLLAVGVTVKGQLKWEEPTVCTRKIIGGEIVGSRHSETLANCEAGHRYSGHPVCPRWDVNRQARWRYTWQASL